MSKKRGKQFSWMLPPEDEKWHPSFPQYVGQKQPPISEREQREIEYRAKVERDQKRDLSVNEFFKGLIQYQQAVQSGKAVEIKKSVLRDEYLNLVKRLVGEKK